MSKSKYFPRRLSFSKICDILVAYLNAGAEREYVGVSDVVNKSNVALHNISRNNNFLKSWGFIEESEKEQGKYKLTREAAEFASAYRINPNDEYTKRTLKSIFSKDEALTKFVERIRHEDLDRNTVLINLQRIVGDLKADKVGLNAFLDMLAYAFQLEKLYSPTKPAKKPERTKAAKLLKRTPRPIFKPTTPVTALGASLSITLSISPEVSPEKLKEYVKAILEAYEEHQKGK